jgi:hypothetical protein
MRVAKDQSIGNGNGNGKEGRGHSEQTEFTVEKRAKVA